MVFKKLLKRLACRSGKDAADEENGLNAELVDKNDTATTGNKRGSTKRSAGSNTKKTPATIDGPFSRYYHELMQSDPFTIKEVDGQFIDTQSSFAPKPRWWIIPIKLCILVWTILIIVDGVMDTFPRAFYMATFDHWALLVTALYLCNSFLFHALRAPSSSKTKKSDKSVEHHLPTTWLKITWALFAVAAPSQVLSAMIFWVLEFRSGGDLATGLVRHGSIWILLSFEGLWINRTPLRVNHQWFFFVFVYIFLLWSLIHSYTGIGNPMVLDDKDYDALYPFLKWNQQPAMATVYSMICIFFVAPFTYWMVWMLSLFSFWDFSGKNRRYLAKDVSRKLESYVTTDST